MCNHRRSITRLRISAHRLKIETGRYIKLDRSERLCDKCSACAVEDEQHFLIECSNFNEYRNNLFQTVNFNNKNFSKLDNFQKIFWLLTNEDSDILHIMGLYLHEHISGVEIWTSSVHISTPKMSYIVIACTLFPFYRLDFSSFMCIIFVCPCWAQNW